jgi:hypothetical protein
MHATDLYRQLLRGAHDFLESTMADVTPEQFTWDPPGLAFSIAANYAHVLTAEDMVIHRLLKGTSLLAETSAVTGFGASELPPLGPNGDFKGWSRRAKVDLGAMRSYAKAVYDASDAHLATLTADDLTRPMDLSQFGFGQQPMLFMLTAILANASLHTGEISCLKGLRGAKGYPV